MGVNTSDWENGLMGLLYDVRVLPLKHSIPTLNLHSKAPQAGMIFKVTQRRGTTTIAMEGTGHGPPVAAQATTITDTRQTHDRNHTKSRRTRDRNSRPYTLSTSDKRTRRSWRATTPEHPSRSLSSCGCQMSRRAGGVPGTKRRMWNALYSSVSRSHSART